MRPRAPPSLPSARGAFQPFQAQGDHLPYHHPFKLLKKKDRKRNEVYTVVILCDPANGIVHPFPICPDGLRKRPTFVWAMEGHSHEVDKDLAGSAFYLAQGLALVGRRFPDAFYMDHRDHLDYLFEFMLPYICEDTVDIERLLSEFCLLYLSQLVDAFLKPPFLGEGEDRHGHDYGLWNVYTWMLIRLSTNPYFGRFMNSGDSRIEELLTVFMTFLVDELHYVFKDLLRKELDDPRKTLTRSKLHLLDFFLTLLEFRWDTSFRDKTDTGTMMFLLDFCDYWSGRARHKPTRELLYRISSTLKGWPSFLAAAENERLVLLRKRTCAYPGCGQRDESCLYSCGKCDTALYCGRSHQRRHYGVHRSVCFDTKSPSDQPAAQLPTQRPKPE